MEKNSTILGRFLLEGTRDAQQRIPDPAQHGIAKAAKALYQPMNMNIWNDFADFMVNRIGFSYTHSKRYDNDLREYEKERVYFGSTVTETALNWVKARSYDQDAVDQFKTYYPDGLQAFHSMNVQKMYPVSITREGLARAFQDENGLNRYIAAQMDTAINSDEYDNYLTMLELFSVADAEYGLFREHVDVTDAGLTKDVCENILEAMQSMAFEFEVPSSRFTLSEIPVFARRDEVTAFVRSDVMAKTNVKALAAAFNLDKAEIPYRVKVVPASLWPLGNDDYAVLTTGDFFQVYPVEYTTTSQFDPAALKTNYFLHDWRIVAFSPFVPCVVISSKEQTVIDTVTMQATGLTMTVSETDDSRVFGIVTDLDGTVTGGNGEVAVKPDSVTFDVSIATADGKAVETNSRTFVKAVPSDDGKAAYVLNVQKGGVSTGCIVTIKATSTYIDPTTGAASELSAEESVTLK